MVWNLNYIWAYIFYLMGFPGGSVVKNSSPMQETWVQFLCWEDPLEKEMATHTRILAWKIPWTEEPGRLQSMESQRVGHYFVTKQPYSTYLIRFLATELDLFSFNRLIIFGFQSPVFNNLQKYVEAIKP